MSALIRASEFFSTARERYLIKMRRDSGLPAPWTEDPQFSRWRFCCVHREDDATTRWFRENVRDPLSSMGLAVTKTTIAFRWFNLVATGEKIRDLLLGDWSSEIARQRLAGSRPVTNGAYIICGYPYMSKLDGVLTAIDGAHARVDAFWGSEKFTPWSSLEDAWGWLVRSVVGLGRFSAYEIVTDLRWTGVLRDAGDVLTWASAGPGAARGLGRIVGDSPGKFSYGSARGQAEMLDLMRELLAMSRVESFWPSEWRRWEMREVEHWLCEFDKYERACEGSRLKRRFP